MDFRLKLSQVLSQTLSQTLRMTRKLLLGTSLGLYKLYSLLPRKGFKPPKRAIEHPSRLFRVPDLARLERVYLILTSLHYEIVEQNIENETFQLLAILEERSPHRALTHFKELSGDIQISIEGRLEENQNWQVRIFFKTAHSLNSEHTKYADLILENITLALGWQNYWIIECAPPYSLAA